MKSAERQRLVFKVGVDQLQTKRSMYEISASHGGEYEVQSILGYTAV
jgi:hypothetical protein